MPELYIKILIITITTQKKFPRAGDKFTKREIIILKTGGNMLKRILFVLTAIIIGINGATAATYEPDEMINISVYEKINPAIVSIEANVSDGFSAGTGCIVREDGLILTGSHVVEGSTDIDITTSNGETYKGEIISIMGKNNDLALLKIKARGKLKTIEFGDSEKVKVGQKVLAIGNPFGFSGTLTQGIVSRIDYSKNKIQTDAAINPGCSGGPLVNSAGEVIGISQSIFNPDNNISNIGIGFAIPINDAKKFIAAVDKK